MKRKKSNMNILCAILTKNIDAIDRLLNAGANPNIVANGYEPCIINATFHNQLDIIKRLVMFGANINIEQHNHTAILRSAVACKHDFTEVAEFLIEMGCDVNCCDNLNKTPLMYACKNDSIQLVKLLIKYKADTNCIDNSNKKAIDYANDDEIKVYLTKN